MRTTEPGVYVRLQWVQTADTALVEFLRVHGQQPPYMGIESLGPGRWVTVFASDEQYETRRMTDSLIPQTFVEPDARFVDPSRSAVPLHELYSEAVALGRRQDVTELIQAVIPGVTHFEILTHPSPALHLVYPDGSVPVGLAGDGIRSLVQLSLEMVTRGKGLVLVEEPEVHQHPGALRQSAKAILASVRRGTQVILSTHSLELIDALLAEATEQDLEFFSTYRLKLQQGTLLTSRLTGKEMAFSRSQIEDDLR